MKRIRVITKEGRSFLLRKGKTLREAKSWQKGYNKHNPKDKIQAVVEVKQPIKKKNSNPFIMKGLY